MAYTNDRLSDFSEETLLREIKRISDQLGRTPTKKDFDKLSKTNSGTLTKRFGSWNEALKRAGLSVRRDVNIPDKELFLEIQRIWDQLGRRPQYKEMVRFGKYSLKPFESRFGTWIKAVEAFVAWKGQSNKPPASQLQRIGPHLLQQETTKRRNSKRLEYGEPIDFLGLRHSPINELGVVYLFGMLSKNLGFIVESIRSNFPDCEAKREIPGKPGRWERVLIEFEFKSSNFKEHSHDIGSCDLIVCWEDDWPHCPIEAISLKKVMNRFHQQSK